MNRWIPYRQKVPEVGVEVYAWDPTEGKIWLTKVVPFHRYDDDYRPGSKEYNDRLHDVTHWWPKEWGQPNHPPRTRRQS